MASIRSAHPEYSEEQYDALARVFGNLHLQYDGRTCAMWMEDGSHRELADYEAIGLSRNTMMLKVLTGSQAGRSYAIEFLRGGRYYRLRLEELNAYEYFRRE